MTPLDIAVPRRQPEKSPEKGINVWSPSRHAASGGLRGKRHSYPLQGPSEVAGQAIAQQAIGAGAQQEDGNRQEAGIPQGQTSTDGARAHDLFHFEDVA